MTPGDDRAAQVVCRVNGSDRTLPAQSTVADLLVTLQLTGGPCAVEINRQIVPRSTHDQHLLRSGDDIEIVSFVGGG